MTLLKRVDNKSPFTLTSKREQFSVYLDDAIVCRKTSTQNNPLHAYAFQISRFSIKVRIN